ncbi:MAG: hypothetical protein IPP94_15525 [Ignavibacteria bacterium]|nr:hypothetical protein [Ignavibacteria bacterium]
MHRTLSIGRLLLLACVLASCANTPYVVISPAKPKPGETLQITYDHSSPDAVFKGTEPLTAHVFLPVRRKENSQRGSKLDSTGKQTIMTSITYRIIDTIVAVPMTREGSRSSASMTLPKEMQSFAFVKFGALGTYDVNRGAAWRLLLHRQDGTPLKGAWADAARSYQYTSFFGILNSNDSVLACYRNERTLYPGNPMLMYSWKYRWAVDSSETMRAEISAELDSILQGFKQNVWSDIPVIWLEKFGRIKEAAVLRARYIAENPPSDTAADGRLMRVWNENDPVARTAAILELMNSGSVAEVSRLNLINSLVGRYCLDANIDSASIWYDSLRTPYIETTLELAALCIRDARYRERGLAVAKAEIDRAFNKDSKGRLLLKEAWPVVSGEFPAEERLLLVSTDGLSRAGRSAELRRFCEDAFESLQGASIMLNTRLAKEYFATKEYARMLRFVTECFDRDRATDDMINYMRMAYIRLNGSDAGYEDSLSAMRLRLRERTRLRISAQRIDKEPLHGGFTTLDGRDVQIADLSGKVVILALWLPDAYFLSRVSRILAHACARFRSDSDVELFSISLTTGCVPEEVRTNLVRKGNDLKCPLQYVVDDGFARTNRIAGTEHGSSLAKTAAFNSARG